MLSLVGESGLEPIFWFPGRSTYIGSTREVFTEEGVFTDKDFQEGKVRVERTARAKIWQCGGACGVWGRASSLTVQQQGGMATECKERQTGGRE